MGWPATDRIRRFAAALAAVPEMQRRQEFLLHEVRRLNEQLRMLKVGEGLDQVQTRASFDYQWHEMPEGDALPSDPEFTAQAQDLVCRMTGRDRDWFPGKRVADIGCGVGRFTLPMLQMGAEVTACDQSSWALKRTQELCEQWKERLVTKQIDLLSWDTCGDYDLVFSYGVVHHTGNTYLAMRNVARKVGPGGHVFFMIYGYPTGSADFVEVNTYERLRQELRDRSMEERRSILVERFGVAAAHGYFDAVSPRINDLLTFEEVGECLTDMGFVDVRRTVESRNIHVVASRP